MAKQIKQSRTIKRTSSIAKCLREARDFARPKRSMTTRSMARQAEENRRKRQEERRVQIAPKKIRKVQVAMPAIPSLPAIASVPAFVAPVAPSIFSSSAAFKSHVTLPSSPIAHSSSQPIRKHVFKSMSKRDISLPLPAFGFIDVCFVIDATGSMSGEIAQAKSTIEAIIHKLQTKVATQGITLRFAIVDYLDHDCGAQYITKIKDFTDGYDAIEYAKALTLGPGGDQPEAIHDAVIDACTKLNWVDLPGTPMLRYIFHIADAPPHGNEFVSHQKQKGCKCGLTTQQMFHEVNLKQIHYRLIKVRPNQHLHKMENIFRKGIVDFECADIKNAHEMDVRVSDMIIHEVLPQADMKAVKV